MLEWFQTILYHCHILFTSGNMCRHGITAFMALFMILEESGYLGKGPQEYLNSV